MLFCLVAQLSQAQTYFEYDQAGNRIRRYYTPVPDLSPVIVVQQSPTYGTSPINLVLDIYELNNVATNGVITVKIPKNPQTTLSLNSGATSVGGRPVQNSVWNLSGPSGGFYTLTSSQVIAAGDMLSFGLNGVLTPGATSGRLSLTAIIVGGSGGEVRINNNSAASAIDYFQN